MNAQLLRELFYGSLAVGYALNYRPPPWVGAAVAFVSVLDLLRTLQVATGEVRQDQARMGAYLPPR